MFLKSINCVATFSNSAATSLQCKIGAEPALNGKSFAANYLALVILGKIGSLKIAFSATKAYWVF